MKNRYLLGAALCTAMAAAPATLGATISFSASLDNTLFQDGTGSLSNGAGPNMFAGLTAQSSIRRALVAFDVSSIPAGSTITGVNLTLYMSQSNSGATPVTLNRVLSSWGEGTSNSGPTGGNGSPATAGDATWLHRFYNTSLWASVGGDFSATASGSKNVAGVGPYSWTSGGMVSDVQAWVDGTSGNYGWALLGDESTPTSSKRFATREAVVESQRPVLEVTYVPAPASAGMLIGALGLAARRRR